MSRPQFSLKTLLWVMAVVGAWCVVCRTVLSGISDPFIRAASVCSFVVATIGIGCIANAARMKVSQDWKRGAVQFAWALLGVVMLVSAVCLWLAGLWLAFAAGAG